MRKSVIPKPQTESYKKQAIAYKQQLLTLGHSKSGANNKYCALLEFLAKLEESGISNIKKVTAKDLNKHYDYLKSRPNFLNGQTFSLKSCFSHMRAVQLFFAQLQASGKITINPASIVKFNYPKESGEYKREVLSQAEIKVLYQFTINYQEKAILSLAYGCGLRAFELDAINIGDIRFSQRILIVPKGKGNKRRVVPMSSRIIADLSAYFYKERPSLTLEKDYQNGEKAFMLHSRGGRMKYYTYNKYLKRIIDRSGNSNIENKEISIHNLRHSIATHLIEQGVSLEKVQTFLGHSSLKSTEIYTHINRKQIQKMKR